MMRTIAGAAEDIRKKRLSPVDLLEECLERIDRYEPKVNAWVLLDREGARAEAKRLAEELRAGQYRGPLHGIPIGIKDIYDVFDWPTAAGSRLWSQSIARQDAHVVQCLRQAGAVFIGKTVTTPFASFDPSITRNPWNLARTPGGSSSGSAAAMACGMCLGTLGSQTGGSITRPASYCGVAGLKPTYGSVRVDGVVPLAPSMDHPGPIASCVKDLSILFDVVASLTHVMTWSGVKAAPRLGRLHGLFDELAEPGMLEMMENVTAKFRQQEATVVDVALPAAFSEVIPRHRTIMAVEAAAYHGERLRRHPDDYPAKIRALIGEGLSCPAPDYRLCLQHQQRLSMELSYGSWEVDAFVTPATTGLAPEVTTTGDPAFNSPWSYTGLPTVSIPAGWSRDGLPFAIQLVGKRSEADLLAVAAWCEQVLEFERREPRP